MTEFMQGYLSLPHLKVLSIQGLLHDDLQRDLCPYYLKNICKLTVDDGIILRRCVSGSKISQSRASEITP